MTIKSRLRLSFFILVGLIIIVSLVLAVSLFVQKSYFERFVKAKDLAIITNDILQMMNQQRQSLNYYIILNDRLEKENYEMIISQVNNLLEKLQIENQKEDYIKEYQELNEYAQELFKEKDYGKKLLIMDNKFIPLFAKYINKITAKNKSYLKDVLNIKARVDKISLLSWIAALVVVTLSFFIVLFFGIKIYNSVLTPLNLLSSAAVSLAKGEYREINYISKDEYAQVINAFNNMIKNLKTLQSQIIQMDRLSNIGQLSGGIAHELNNPLVGVLGQAQILLEKIPPDSSLREHVEKIERAAKRCRESVSKLLQFSRQKEYEYNQENINEVIKGTLFIVDSELKAHNIELICLFKDNLPTVKISVPHIQQALLNIINNAIQAIAIKGDNKNFLQIKTFVTKADPTDVYKNYVGVEIQDSGCGIETKYLESIFDPFFTTKDKSKFAGVGLAITKDIILHHKGKISAFSEGKNQGAKFTIYLPVT